LDFFMPTTSGQPLMSNPLPCSENENREPAHFQRLLRHRSVPASFLRQILTPATLNIYPVSTGSASIRRTMLANNRRVR
jgi:hypothetical protein